MVVLEAITFDTVLQDVLDSLIVDKSNDLYWTVALCGEVGEYANFIKKENRTNGFRFKYKQETEDELMDCLYYVVAACHTRGIDMNKAWHRKMNHNEIKYDRVVKDRPFTCDCQSCEAKKK
jgi:NTP pyrophosphatase (non-canonical NTP hydrolase)